MKLLKASSNLQKYINKLTILGELEVNLT